MAFKLQFETTEPLSHFIEAKTKTRKESLKKEGEC